MPTSLDLDPRAMTPGKLVAQDLQRQRDAEEEKRQQAAAAAARTGQLFPHQLAQEQEAAAKATNAGLERTMRADLATASQDPDLAGKPFNKIDPYYRQSLANSYGPVADKIAPAWEAAQAQNTGGIPGLELHGASMDQSGNVTKNFAAPDQTTSGQVTEFQMAEAGIDTAGVPRSQWQSLLAAKKEPVKAKLDVQQKAALGSAAQAVPVIAKALEQYKNLGFWKTGPALGRWQGLKNKVGYGDEEYAKANAQLRGNLFNVARSLQGAGVLTEKDMTRMEEIAPSLQMNEATFKGQTEAVRELLNQRLTVWRDLNANALDESQRALADRLIEQTNPQTAPAMPVTGNPATPSTQPISQQPIKTVTTREQFDALPSGATYIGKNGQHFRKP